MLVDKVTLIDLSIFGPDEHHSIFHALDFTETNGGREKLKQIMHAPHSKLESILDAQTSIKRFIDVGKEWPTGITNGTTMVLQKYFESAVASFPKSKSSTAAFFYKFINPNDYSLIKYTVEHCVAFLKNIVLCKKLLEGNKMASSTLNVWNNKISLLLDRSFVHDILAIKDIKDISITEILYYGQQIKQNYKADIYELISIYSEMDAYIGLSKACVHFGLTFPTFINDEIPSVQWEGLFHLQLEKPVPYDMHFGPQNNFLFLTGANMGGKSTFIKSMGISLYLAHLGMGVPAKKMSLTVFHGLLSNIHVADNLTRGESYFFNEVHRIKDTVNRVKDKKKWLVLIDELFKGTNIEDAMKCSTTVIEGLRKMDNAIFVVSTHLYEISSQLKKHNNIQFRYFETTVKQDQLHFSYKLMEGVSSDRLGYLILKREGVVDLLDGI